MSEKSSSSSGVGRPPSQPSSSALLLMPTGSDFGGLGGDGPGGPSLMPAVVRAEGGGGGSPQLLASDEDTEVDSFIGQSSMPDLRRPSPFSMFQQQAGHDPFSDVLQTKADFASVRPMVTSAPQTFSGQPPALIRTTMPGPVPLPNISQMPLQNVPLPAQTVLPFSSTVAPPSVTSAPANFYRMSGKPQYVAPPLEMQSFSQPDHGKPGYLPGQPMSGVPLAPQTGFLPGQPQQQQSQHQGPGFLPRPFEPGGTTTSFGTSAFGGQTLPSEMDSTTRSYHIHPPVALPAAAGHVFQPMQPHWFHRTKIEGKDIWKPFSNLDSRTLEESLKQGASAGHLVSVAGGRYEVNVRQRLQTAIYWHEEASPVRRCLWFYRPDGENRFVPYEEEFSAELEESYKRTVLTSDFHKRLVFPSGETVVIHNPQVIVQFTAAAQPDAYGITSTESRPRVVKRGVVELDETPPDEHPVIDHLVLVVQGISSTCGLRFRNIVDCVNSFRGVASDMMKSHFKQAVDERRAGRIEFLPVRWHEALRGHAAGLDRMLKSITLGSVGKLRQFSNDHLLDVLIYRSPVYTQDIATMVGNELNRLVQLFRSRNPSFTGGISVAGHGLGAQVLFDILLNQSFSDDPEDGVNSAVPEVSLAEADAVQASENENTNGKTPSSDETSTDADTLESVLQQLGLSEYLENFKKEQIDLKSLRLCEDSDMKEMGVPLGPRKKLQGFLKQYAEKQALKRAEAERKAQQMAQLKAKEEARKLEQAASLLVKDPLLTSANNSSVMYTIGAVGIGCPFVKHPQLKFAPENFFALGSSVAMFLTMKGTESLGEEFMLPTCPGFFNIFHPFDPLAYRMEPLVVSAYPPKPVQIPHHQGRKRLHLELKESLTRIGYDLKQRIIDSVKNTWKSINSFAMGHMLLPPPQDEVEREVDTVLSEMTKDVDDSSSVVASSVADEDDIPMGSVNQGRRVDFVLQEKPIEIFNDYMFALGSYSCYWESEDTALMMLKEIYLLMGIVPKKFGSEFNPLAHAQLNAASPPPKIGFVPPPTASRGISNPLLQAGPGIPNQFPSSAIGPTSQHSVPPLPSAAAIQPLTTRPMLPMSSTQIVGPPPMYGFVKK